MSHSDARAARAARSARPAEIAEFAEFAESPETSEPDVCAAPAGAASLAAFTELLDLERIRQVKYRYLRCVDQKRWDEIAGVFTPGATASYGTPALGGSQISLEGRDAIVSFLRENMGPTIISVHHASQPEITVDGGTAAGTWHFEDMIIATEYNTVIKGAAFYEDRYAREADGQWRISHTGYQRTYEAMMSTDDLKSFRLTANRWAPPPA